MKINLINLLAFSSAISEIMSRDFICNGVAVDEQAALLQTLNQAVSLDSIDEKYKSTCQEAIRRITAEQDKLQSNVVPESSDIESEDIYEPTKIEFAEVIQEWNKKEADLYYLAKRARELQLMLPERLISADTLINAPIEKTTKRKIKPSQKESVEKSLEAVAQLNPQNYETSLALRHSMAQIELNKLEAIRHAIPSSRQAEITSLLNESIKTSGNIFRSSFGKYKQTREHWQKQLIDGGFSQDYSAGLTVIRDYYLHSNELFPENLETALLSVKDSINRKQNNLAVLMATKDALTGEYQELFQKLNSAQLAYVVENGLRTVSAKVGVQAYIPGRIFPDTNERANSAFMFLRKEERDRAVVYFFCKEVFSEFSDKQIDKMKKELQKPLSQRKAFSIKVEAPANVQTKKPSSHGIRRT